MAIRFNIRPGRRTKARSTVGRYAPGEGVRSLARWVPPWPESKNPFRSITFHVVHARRAI
jgi:hypothetical protein